MSWWPPRWARPRAVSQQEIKNPASLDRRLLELLRDDVDFLRTHPRMPPLYACGVRYRGALPGEECWLPIPRALESYLRGGTLDCKSLATWRAAELIIAGEPASCFWTVAVEKTAKGPSLLFHVLVRRADGSVEDPSLRLGMGWAEAPRPST